jgi:hypothetical protein
MPQPRIYASGAERQVAYRRRQRAVALHPQTNTSGLVALPRPTHMPGTVRWRQAVAQAHGLLETVEQEMEDYFGDRTQEWQEGERGERFQERMDALCEAKDMVEALTSA